MLSQGTHLLIKKVVHPLPTVISQHVPFFQSHMRRDTRSPFSLTISRPVAPSFPALLMNALTWPPPKY